MNRPGRIVSLYACLDAVLVRVADRGQVAAISRASRDPRISTISALAATLPVVRGSAEEIVALRPDLVLGSRYSPPETLAALARLGVPVARFDVPKTVADGLEQTRRIAALVGRPDRGARILAEVDAALRRAAPPPGAPPMQALIFQRDGYAAGPDMPISEMLRRTGFQNIAPRYGVRSWGRIPLERLLADPPRVLLCGQTDAHAPSWGETLLRHPALKRIAQEGRTTVLTLPERLLHCGGPVLVQTAAALADARMQSFETRPSGRSSG